MALDRQIHIYSVDTGAFFTRAERNLHWKMTKFRKEKEKIDKEIDQLEICFRNDNFESVKLNSDDALIRYEKLIGYKKDKTDKIGFIKSQLLALLKKKTKVEFNNIIRTLHDKHIRDTNVISVFESYLTRTLGISSDIVSTDIIVVKVFYFDLLRDLIQKGFVYNGEKYIYFTSSAGQIRTKKTVFIKEKLWDQHQQSLMCGLSLDLINTKGGININKYLAYLALTNSATDEWSDFDITKSIVVPDFETNVLGLVDFIDDVNYTIDRQSMSVPIAHTDGCGMILPSLSSKNFMVRLPWVKGLLAVFDFREFINQHPNASPIVTDIYGKQYDIFKDDIQIIFTESQFKMHKYYDSWQQYQEYFIKYNCHAGKCNIEDDKIPNAKINYQMLQTLTAIKPDEMLRLASNSNNKLDRLTSSVSSMLDAFGATDYNTNKTDLQKCLQLYPELLNDVYTREIITKIKNSLLKSYRSGKLEVKGKFTYLIPDLYAFCQFLFMGDKSPCGILKDQEVSCRIYNKTSKLDCLRSPHLYKEHAVRNNVVNDRTQKWFVTDAIYTSCHDLISKILQFDVDGDKSLVVADPLFVKIAERSMVDIVPLYYNMRKAEPSYINSEKIYQGLETAYVGGNIGAISNDITKIWNSDFWYCDDDESIKNQNEALTVIKYLCMENNFTIDHAKTLYKPIRPNEINILIRKYTNQKVPYFFQYAKDKEIDNVAKINGSFSNKLTEIIKNRRLHYKLSEFGKLDYKLLMKNKNIRINHNLIEKYRKLNSTYHYKINMESKYNSNISYIAKEICEELRSFGYSDEDVCDMLVKYLYGDKRSKSKESLWFCYGDIIYKNLENNIIDLDCICMKCGRRYKKDYHNQEYCVNCGSKYQPVVKKNIVCVDCGKEIVVDSLNSKTFRCEDCQSLANYTPIITKTIVCVDCGKEVEVDARNMTKERCDECYKKYRREYYKIQKQNQRLKFKMK